MLEQDIEQSQMVAYRAEAHPSMRVVLPGLEPRAAPSASSRYRSPRRDAIDEQHHDQGLDGSAREEAVWLDHRARQQGSLVLARLERSRGCGCT
jgi:hypothetical protein